MIRLMDRDWAERGKVSMTGRAVRRADRRLVAASSIIPQNMKKKVDTSARTNGLVKTPPSNYGECALNFPEQ
ncbi:hypothetical protein EVAR_5020_1 [Eumeta japonica]|uniref:Uncharacterized protein n=1 Tax=Eumeta variegata TaxID=151549 RepID=A0A4C1STW6_EUMVA|nr:hypothetical protein EVAR_5020_1 [Eumeta japonica]